MKLTDPIDWTTGTKTGELNGLDDFAETTYHWPTHWLTNRNPRDARLQAHLKEKVANMELDMVAHMEVDKVADIEVDMVADINIDMEIR